MSFTVFSFTMDFPAAYWARKRLGISLNSSPNFTGGKSVEAFAAPISPPLCAVAVLTSPLVGGTCLLLLGVFVGFTGPLPCPLHFTYATFGNLCCAVVPIGHHCPASIGGAKIIGYCRVVGRPPPNPTGPKATIFDAFYRRRARTFGANCPQLGSAIFCYIYLFWVSGNVVPKRGHYLAEREKTLA
jgi:hypothetical protein